MSSPCSTRFVRSGGPDCTTATIRSTGRGTSGCSSSRRRSSPSGAGSTSLRWAPVSTPRSDIRPHASVPTPRRRAPFERVMMDGAPASAGDVPEPVTAGIVFRVGTADGSLLEHGLNALVAELAAVDVEGMSWIVHETSTIFFTSGKLSEVTHALTSVCAALRALSEDDAIDLAD